MVGLLHRGFEPRRQTIHGDAFAVLELERLSIRHGHAFPGNDGLEFAIRTRAFELQCERERFVRVTLCALRPHNLLRHMQRANSGKRLLAVVAEAHGDIVHLPFRRDRIRRGVGRVRFLRSRV